MCGRISKCQVWIQLLQGTASNQTRKVRMKQAVRGMNLDLTAKVEAEVDKLRKGVTFQWDEQCQDALETI